MKLQKLIIVSAITLALAGHFSTLTARDSIDQRLIEEAMPMVEKTTDSFLVQAPFINNLVVMNVRVYNQQGEQVLYVRSYGEPVELLAADLPDGKYSYQANTIFSLDEPIGEGADYREEGLSEERGEFSIEKGAVVRGDTGGRTESYSLNSFLMDQTMAIAGKVLSMLVTDALAADVTVESSIPIIRFKDQSAGTELFDYSFIAEATENSGGFWTHEYQISGFTGNLFQASFGANAAPLHNSMIINTSGDISWAGNGMTFDRSSQQLSIGSAQILANLGIASASPDIHLHDETDTSEMQLQLSNGEVQLWGRATDIGLWHNVINYDVNAPSDSFSIGSSGDLSAVQGASIGTGVNTIYTIFSIGNSGSARAQMEFIETAGSAFIEWGQADNLMQFEGPDGTASVQFNLAAPEYSLVVGGEGNLGIGTNEPSTDIHVKNDDGTAKILVEETNTTAAPRTLFQLKNKGNTKFGVLNTEFGVEWAFANPGTAFRLSRQGSGVVEMEIFNNGNVKIAGALTENSDVNAKTAITDIDHEEILKLVSELPVSQWEYKDARGETHIGPMAQDFYASFGLGATETGISTIDTAGVALAAIKALHTENISLKQQNASIQVQNTDLLQRLEKLERQQSEMRLMMVALIEAGQTPEVLAKISMN